MSLAEIQRVVDQFIVDGHNDLLVIKGQWGAGKTYFWEHLIAAARQARRMGKSSYSYVSLFGVNNLQELKNTIVLTQQDIQVANSSKGVRDVTSLVRQLGILADKSPMLQHYSGGIASQAAFMTVRDALICFDDIERRGDGLAVKDVMGLASLLKEQHDCQVVFIMNKGGFSHDEVEEFQLHSEKVVDITLQFSPSSEDAFGYVFLPDHPHYAIIRQCCLKLNIRNIRILQRIGRFIDSLHEHFEHSEAAVVEDALRSLILCVWCYYDKDSGAPPLAYVRKFEFFHAFLGAGKQDVTPEEATWNSLLAAYGYRGTDELNEHFIHLVETGYLNSDAFASELDKRNQAVRAQQGQDAYAKVWDLYSNSFENNEEEFVKQLTASFRLNMPHMKLSNLQGAVWVLGELNRDQVADSLIDEYFVSHKDALVRVHRDDIMFMNQVKHQKIIGRLNAIWASARNQQTIAEVVKKLASRDGWSLEDVEILEKAEVDDFYDLFKSMKSANLPLYVKACLKFGEVSSENPSYAATHQKVQQALRKIASESRINQLRVSARYGIEIDHDASTS